jgi:hypothetical protein
MKPIFAILLLAAAGCGAADPCASVHGACINLTITSTTALTVDTVRVTASGAAMGMQSSMAGKLVHLPVDVPIALPATAGGALMLFVEGINQSQVVASGEADLNINLGAHLRATVDIEPQVVVPPDMATVPLGPDLGISLDTACADQAHSLCSRFAACSTVAPAYIFRKWGDQATCEARYKLDCMTEAMAPGSGVTGASIERCAMGFAAQPCADRFAGFLPPVCVTTGTRMKGQGCTYDSQCQSGFCKLTGLQACGACDAPTTGGSSACTMNGDCSDRQTCAMNVCQLFAPLNGACSAAKPCAEQLTCVGGICKQDGASAGVACDATAMTQAQCDTDLGFYCASNNTCAFEPTATTANPQCGFTGGVRTVCSGGADCFGGTCKPPAADNAACDAMNGPTCRFPARCVAGVCHVPTPSACN